MKEENLIGAGSSNSGTGTNRKDLDTRILAREGRKIDNRMIETNREIREDRIKKRLRESIEEIDV